MTATPPAPARDAPLSSPSGMTRSGVARIEAIDRLRGLVIVLMVLDHVRDFFHRTALTADPLAMDSGDPALFLTRWVTHLCAPTFVFLAGVSVWMQRDGGKRGADLSRFLATRGLWLILLELTVIGIGFNFGWWVFLQVIWAIGVGMAALAGLIWVPRTVVLVLGAVIVVGHPALRLVPPEAFGPLELAWRSLAVFGPVQTPLGFGLIAYPALPWIGMLLVGYGLGPMFAAGASRRWVMMLGLGALAAFAVLRGMNLSWVDPRPWAVQAEPLWMLFSFLNVSKYPPSLTYALVTMGLALLLYLVLDKVRGAVGGVMTTFGRTPLFTYLIHVWLAHGLAVVVGIATGVPASAFLGAIVDPSRLVAAGWGFGLFGVYAAWLTTLLLLYPLSRWFEGVKRRRRDAWLGYL